MDSKEKEINENEINKNKIFSNVIFVTIGAIISCLLWGSAYPMIKLGYREFQISSDMMASQILFAGIRFTLAGILAILLGCIIQRKVLIPKKSSIPMIMKLSLFQTTLQYFFFYVGLAHTTGVRASIIQGTNVFVVLVVAGLIFKQEKISFAKAFGCIAGFVGVVLVSVTDGGVGSGNAIVCEYTRQFPFRILLNVFCVVRDLSLVACFLFFRIRADAAVGCNTELFLIRLFYCISDLPSGRNHHYISH